MGKKSLKWMSIVFCIYFCKNIKFFVAKDSILIKLSGQNQTYVCTFE